MLGVHRNKCLEAVFSQATSSVLIPRTTLYLRTHQPVPATQPVPPRYIIPGVEYALDILRGRRIHSFTTAICSHY